MLGGLGTARRSSTFLFDNLDIILSHLNRVEKQFYKFHLHFTKIIMDKNFGKCPSILHAYLELLGRY